MSWHLLTGVLGMFDILSIISYLYLNFSKTFSLPRAIIRELWYSPSSHVLSLDIDVDVTRAGKIETPVQGSALRLL